MVTEIRIKSYRLFFLSSKNLAALCHPSPEPLRIPINTSESTTGRQTRESIEFYAVEARLSMLPNSRTAKRVACEANS